MGVKQTLLEITQNILSYLDSEEVNSIADSVESMQVATIVRDTYYNLITNSFIPEHETLLKLESFSDSAHPTHFSYPANVKKVKTIWYDHKDGGLANRTHYKEILWVEPEEFLRRINVAYEDSDEVLDPNSGTTLLIRNNQNPSYYTSFDDQTLVFNSYDKTIEATLQTSKTRAYGSVFPSFIIEDDFTPELQANYFPLLVSEAKSVAFSTLKGYIDPKVDQASRRQRSAIQNDKFVSERPNKWNDYGRKGPTGRRRPIDL